MTICVLCCWISLPAAAITQPHRADLVQNITTHVLSRGDLVVNLGSGIVIGDLFITAYHNLDPQYQNLRYQTESYLEGVRVWPLLSDAHNDLAVIRIPAELCKRWCNQYKLTSASEIGLQQGVEWVRKIEPGTTWKSARVLSLTAPATRWSASGQCNNGLVVEITKPFVPGSSGTAVWDALTHELVGMALGSFELANGEQSGYFKPIRCIYKYLEAAGITTTR